MRDKTNKNRYQNNWIKNRRLKWLQENGPCIKCLSWVNLEIDHIDPTTKITHAFWSWTKTRREDELKKCQVLCRICHKLKSRLESCKGEEVWSSILSENDVLKIRAAVLNGTKQKDLAKEYSVCKQTISDVILRKKWKHI